jgi:hypothetical protein
MLCSESVNVMQRRQRLCLFRLCKTCLSLPNLQACPDGDKVVQHADYLLQTSAEIVAFASVAATKCAACEFIMNCVQCVKVHGLDNLADARIRLRVTLHRSLDGAVQTKTTFPQLSPQV